MAESLLFIIKIVLSILLLPVIYACTINFSKHLTVYPTLYADFFMWGAGSFLLSFLFLYRFEGLYVSGQKIVAAVFKMFSPLDRILGNMLPFYATIVLLTFYVTSNLLGMRHFNYQFMFLAGFAFSMHILLTTRELQDQEKLSIKIAYLFMMSLVFIFNVFFLVLFLDLITGKFTFPLYFNAVMKDAGDVYTLISRKIL